MNKAFRMIAILMFLPLTISAQGVGIKSALCLSVYFDIENLKLKTEERIKSIESALEKNRQTINDVNNILAEIQKVQLSGTESQRKEAAAAEPVAQEAMLEAREAQKKLELQRVELQMELNLLKEEQNNITSNLCNELARPDAGGLVKNCSGEVKIIKSGGREETCSKYFAVREGDEIVTGEDGQAQAYLLDGRGRVSLGPNSRVNIIKSSSEGQILDVASGQVQVAIEKLEIFREKLKKWGASYREDLETIQEWFKDEKKQLELWLCKKGQGKKCEKEPRAVIGPRGTYFIIDRQGENEAKIVVLEGQLEITITDKKKAVIVESGYEAIINYDGTIILQKTTQEKL